MSTEFEFFEGTATVNSTTPRVTVRKAGQLVLTEAAVAMLGEGVEAVQIGYNAKSRVVGIRPAADGVRGALKLRAQPNGRSKLVDAKRFFAHRGLAVDKVLAAAKNRAQMAVSAGGSHPAGALSRLELDRPRSRDNRDRASAPRR